MVRIANKKDIPVIVAMASAMHAESPFYGVVPFRAEDIAEFINVALSSPDYFVVVAEDKDGRPAGMFGGFESHYIFNFKSRKYTDFGFYVRPEHRGGLYAVRMLRAFEEWVRTRGGGPISLGESTGVNPDIVGALLSKMGYNKQGSIYGKEV